MSSERTKLRNSLTRAHRSLTRRGDARFLDFGIELYVVRQDLADGVQPSPDLPPLARVRPVIRLGGKLDLVLGRFVGPADHYVRWYVGERQVDILLRRDPQQSRTLLYSAEGAGKTVLMAQWLIIQIIALILAGESGNVGATAPTDKRLKTLTKAVAALIPCDTPNKRRDGAWATYHSDERELRFPTGHAIQYRSTKKASEATGSPVQGYSWKASGDDELQDTAANGADPDIEARLRAARISYRMCTATAKDSSEWRSFRDKKIASPDWAIERLRYNETPFVWPEHWERMQRNVSPREWLRRGEAQDVPSELATYPYFDRALHLIRVPRTARDVTELALGGYASFTQPGARFRALVGHDPGLIENTSVVLKAFWFPGNRLTWIVVDEFVTSRTTTEQHAEQFKTYLQDKHDLQYDAEDEDDPGDLALVLSDPHSRSEKAPDMDVYQAFRKAGFDVFSAAPEKQVIKKRTRVEMLNKLMVSPKGGTRLFFACDEDKQPITPKLIAALETQEVDEKGRPEMQKKGKNDTSHPAVALGYALWMFEREDYSEVTYDQVRRALAA